MFSLQTIFGKGDKFFSLLEAASEESRRSVQALIKIIQNSGQTPTLDEFVLARRKENRINEQISEQLLKTFVTALEREDIEALSNVIVFFGKYPDIDFMLIFLVRRSGLSGSAWAFPKSDSLTLQPVK